MNMKLSIVWKVSGKNSNRNRKGIRLFLFITLKLMKPILKMFNYTFNTILIL